MQHCTTVFLFLFASSAGAFLRFGIMESLTLLQSSDALVWGVFIANMLGCYFFGLFWVFVEKRNWNARIALVAFLGSLTTFSSYIFDIYSYVQSQSYWLIFGNSLLQIGLGILLLRLGIFSAQGLLRNR